MLQFQMGGDTSALIKGHSWNKAAWKKPALSSHLIYQCRNMTPLQL